MIIEKIISDLIEYALKHMEIVKNISEYQIDIELDNRRYFIYYHDYTKCIVLGCDGTELACFTCNSHPVEYHTIMANWNILKDNYKRLVLTDLASQLQENVNDKSKITNFADLFDEN